MTEPVTDFVAELSIRANAAEARRASMWLERTGVECGVPAEQLGRLDHCLDEALANIIAYGGASARSCAIDLQFKARRGPQGREAVVTVSDAGTAFDSLAVQLKPRPRTLAEAEPGGLGLIMIRNFADSLLYRHSEGRNHLTFAVHWGKPH
jgi:serine/threonine-protein kinase RsbW